MAAASLVPESFRERPRLEAPDQRVPHLAVANDLNDVGRERARFDVPVDEDDLGVVDGAVDVTHEAAVNTDNDARLIHETAPKRDRLHDRSPPKKRVIGEAVSGC